MTFCQFFGLDPFAEPEDQLEDQPEDSQVPTEDELDQLEDN